ncbi:RNA-binding cell elongation regulator Jag/EloR [Hydrogenoanaerobacterium sp.]|uniref:RNA-binding cell elongation regulator Jag/EloR n=1 Tax=Hydrogenoanaerobacterium sp. TaxID=2953763 RepID=UPI002899C8B1|nr:RNA-binding cell elongation regulator Jag/EloR [Hydrogenoanaerobacterium sp.]
MNREAICVGKTVEEALERAYAELGANGDNSEFEILERPKRSLFGLKVTPAKVKVTMEVPDEVKPAVPKAVVKPAVKPAPKSEPKPVERATDAAASVANPATGEKVDCAVKYLSAIFQEMGLAGVEIKASTSPDGAVLTLSGEGLGVLIGRRGETLDALQYLSGLVANRLEGDYFRITIDSGNYREKREKTLEQLAKKLSAQVIKNGRNLTLEPMNPYERRIIHATVQNIEGVTSSSIGEEPNRRVVISTTTPRKKYPPRDGAEKGGKRPYNNRGRGGNGSRGGNRDGKPHEFRKNTNTAPVSTRPNAFADSMKAAQTQKSRIDDSHFEIEPPVRTAAPRTVAEAKPQAPKNTPPAEVKDKPLYSKIDID